MFYGADLARIHHRAFGDVAESAAALALARLDAAGLTSGTVVDLGCGSGTLARIVSDAGYGVVGVDLSETMLELARANAPAATFTHGSLLDVDIPPAVAVLATGEGLSYATDERAGLDQVADVARRVHEALVPGGIFLFDVCTPGRTGPAGAYERFHDHGDWALHVTVTEDRAQRRLDRAITVFTRTGDGTYRRNDEHHVLRLYEADEIERVLREAGFDVELRDRYSDAATPLQPPEGWTVALATPSRP